MITKEIADFLLPQNDPIQLVFGGVIVTLLISTIVGVLLKANPNSWENKWNNGTSDDTSDDLDAEHGSVNDISTAVATTAEKMADIMPGILLILGLLGTFLGLGMALNKASTILMEANAGGGMDSAMANLMGMMEGLGTKFKTSTWGIMAFLLLKAWSAIHGYEEKRLRWCVIKMKVAFEDSRKQQINAKELAQNNILETIRSTRQEIINQSKSVTPQLETFNTTGSELSSLLSGITKLLELQAKHSEQQSLDLKSTRESLESFIEVNSQNLTTIQNSATEMATAAGSVSKSADNLQTAIESFKEGVSDVLGTLKQDLGNTISQMGSSFSQNMDSISVNMAKATDGISGAVHELSENVGTTMDNVGKSIDESMAIQKQAQAEFLITSGTLNEKVISMTELVNDLRERIVSGLKAVSESGRRMASLDDRYQAITESSASSAAAIDRFINELKLIQEAKSVENGLATLQKETQSVEKQLVALQKETQISNTKLSSIDNHLKNLGQVADKLNTADNSTK